MNQAPLIVHTDWFRAWGGKEIRILTELREMKKLGFRVGMIVREDSELARLRWQNMPGSLDHQDQACSGPHLLII